MNTKILIFICIVIVFSLVGCFLFNKCFKTFHNEKFKHQNYNGLVLFDIDGTLSVKSKENNYKVVEYCLNKGYAVGISTAGGIYSMHNLMDFEWMPKNLYDFMKDNNSITFNNVRSMYVTGIYHPESFNKIYNNSNLNIMEQFGYAKGFTMYKTAKLLGIVDPQKLILCDDMQPFITGYKIYNRNYNFVYCGDKEGLSLNKIKNIIK
jgi:hypothetical protein